MGITKQRLIVHARCTLVIFVRLGLLAKTGPILVERAPSEREIVETNLHKERMKTHRSVTGMGESRLQ